MTDLPPCQAASELRRLTDAALSAVAPDGAVLRHLHLDGGKLTLIDESGAPAWSGRLDAYRRIRVLGAGKGAAPMAAALENLLGDRISDGLVIVKYGHDLPEGQRTRHIRIKEGGHPVPDEAGAAAAGEIVDMARDSREDDLVLCTFTGGASALTPALHPKIPLADMQRLTCMLLECGATIHEINTLRKHLSRFSGGSLVRAAFPATVLGLIVSDVVGDDLDVIASGPTVPDPSTFADCLRVVEHYGLRWKMPQSIWAHIEGGLQGRTPETPKADEPAFGRVRNVLVASVKQALEAAADEAARCGFVPRILTTAMSGEARRTAAQLVAEARRAQAGLRPGDAPLCLLAGGETTVTIRGSGTGKTVLAPSASGARAIVVERPTAASTSFAWGPTARTAPRTRRAATPSAAIWHGCAPSGCTRKKASTPTTATPCCSRPEPSCAPAPRAPMSWIWPSCWSGRNNRSRKLFLGLFGYVQGEKRRVIVLVHDRRVRTGSGTGRPGKALDADKRGAKRTGTAYRPSGLRGGNGPAGSTDMGGDHVWFMVFLGQPRVAARRVLRVRRVRGKSVRS